MFNVRKLLWETIDNKFKCSSQLIQYTRMSLNINRVRLTQILALNCRVKENHVSVTPYLSFCKNITSVPSSWLKNLSICKKKKMHTQYRVLKINQPSNFFLYSPSLNPFKHGNYQYAFLAWFISHHIFPHMLLDLEKLFQRAWVIYIKYKNTCSLTCATKHLGPQIINHFYGRSYQKPFA